MLSQLKVWLSSSFQLLPTFNRAHTLLNQGKERIWNTNIRHFQACFTFPDYMYSQFLSCHFWTIYKHLDTYVDFFHIMLLHTFGPFYFLGDVMMSVLDVCSTTSTGGATHASVEVCSYYDDSLVHATSFVFCCLIIGNTRFRALVTTLA